MCKMEGIMTKKTHNTKTHNISLRFTNEQWDHIANAATAVGLRAYGFVKQAALNFDVTPTETKALLKKTKRLSISEILESVTVSTPIKAHMTTEEIKLYNDFISAEQELIAVLKEANEKRNITLEERLDLLHFIKKSKEKLVEKLERD